MTPVLDTRTDQRHGVAVCSLDVRHPSVSVTLHMHPDQMRDLGRRLIAEADFAEMWEQTE